MPEGQAATRRAIVAALVSGAVAAFLYFAGCCWIASLPAPTDTSIVWVFRPWWDNWVGAVGAFFVVGVIVGVLVALRPVTSKRGSA